MSDSTPNTESVVEEKITPGTLFARDYTEDRQSLQEDAIIEQKLHDKNQDTES